MLIQLLQSGFMHSSNHQRRGNGGEISNIGFGSKIVMEYILPAVTGKLKDRNFWFENKTMKGSTE